jgi:lipopolysaccharide transport system permease protein
MLESALIGQLTRREIETRYRGSLLGVVWSLLTPLFMLAVFTFVFAFVLRARWGEAPANATQFALIIFAGLTTFNLFAEPVMRAPTLIIAVPNLVTKVVFPLQVLPIVALGSALFQASISTVILIAFQIAFGSGLHLAALLLPVLILPLCLFTLGLSWFLAALGVYVRDVGQIMPPVVTGLMFLSPIFYPISALPPRIRPLVEYSPLAYSIETVRDAVIMGVLPDAAAWLTALALGILSAALGLAFFQKTRKGFADVL